jgi:2-oxoglutarate dehydrogenase E2 component (dihydrolipoamide succinyltransferase)
MSVEIRVPSLGESIVDATVGSWLKHEGDAVRQGDTLVELETDKVNVEVPAEQDGILQKIIKQEGDTVAVGEVLGMIGEGTGASTDGATSPGATVKTEQQASQGAPEAQRPPSPLARRVAAEHDVDLSQVKGTSPHGRITKEDVLTYLERKAQQPAQPSPPVTPAQPSGQTAQAQQPQQTLTSGVATAPTAPSPPPPQLLVPSRGREERIRLSRRRQTIAQRLVEAQHTAAMLTTFNEIDMSAIMEIRSRRKDTFKERHNISLGFMSFFTKATVGALKAFPRLNAEIQGNEIVLKYYYDIGIAVSAEE